MQVESSTGNYAVVSPVLVTLRPPAAMWRGTGLGWAYNDCDPSDAWLVVRAQPGPST
eukprot:m.474038 g.474038  ORF g.474038 m.474038 type:complete len:57 (+) comp35533_c0_seq1:126-296(+)